jgi:uncharacterized protein (TIGR03437 family)
MLCAQALPPATLAAPYSFDLGADFVNPSDVPPGFTATLICTLEAGSLPPGLTLQSAGLLSGTPTASGNYLFTVNFTLHLEGDGDSLDVPLYSVPLSLQVTTFSGPAISIDGGVLSFPLSQGSTALVSGSIGISNRGTQAQNFTASASSNSGGRWLTVSPPSGSVGAVSSGSVFVSVNPGNLTPGTYRGTVSISVSPAGQSATIPVIVTISATAKLIQLSDTGLRFQTVAAGGTPPSQSIVVLNGGSGALGFSVSASTLFGGQWLSVSPSAGSVGVSSSVAVVVGVNPAGLQPGDYYGQIQFSSPGVDNSPQTATIVLNVAAAGTDLGPFVFPAGLILVGAAGGADPNPKTVQITNPSRTALTFNAVSSFDQGKTFFTAQPQSGSASATSPVQLSVQAKTAGLPSGVYSGDLALRFSDNITRHVFILLIVTPAGTSAGPTANLAQSACTPTKLLPVFTQLGQGFSTVASWPTAIAATIVDDYGAGMISGSVVASFSSGDPPLSLVSLLDGRWSTTWQARSTATQVVITIKAQQASPAIQGSQSIGGALQSNPSAPVISAGGVVSAASFAGQQALAPGSFISVFGAHFGLGTNLSLTLPLETQLGATQAILGGRQLPMQFTVDGQINAIIPYDVPANTTQQLVVLHGPAVSVPEPVVIAGAQPAVFSQNQTGRGAGVVVGVKPDGTQFSIDANNPASAGDVLVIYCAGLGAVDPQVVAGSATPLAPLSNTVNPVSVTLGGKSLAVLFAGLTPQYAGLYQVNAIIPTGVTPGDAVPLVVSAAGQDSVTVTVAIK